jgi:flagella basal body P-ring formation protein FlgA
MQNRIKNRKNFGSWSISKKINDLEGSFIERNLENNPVITLKAIQTKYLVERGFSVSIPTI